MAEPAISRMTLAEFLRWEDGTDTRWQLIDGVPVATAPPAVTHGIPYEGIEVADAQLRQISAG
ncbi:MAG TPA: hypothetical protein VM755_00375 [Stellaceae bacterium]|nr:hypothetical protein [Stellaceae bacterium]